MTGETGSRLREADPRHLVKPATPVVDAPATPARPGKPSSASSSSESAESAAARIQPLDVTGVRTMAVGAAAWVVVFCVLLALHDSLRSSGREWWLWTCVAGFVIGVAGAEHCRRRERRIAKRAKRDS